MNKPEEVKYFIQYFQGDLVLIAVRSEEVIKRAVVSYIEIEDNKNANKELDKYFRMADDTEFFGGLVEVSKATIEEIARITDEHKITRYKQDNCVIPSCSYTPGVSGKTRNTQPVSYKEYLQKLNEEKQK